MSHAVAPSEDTGADGGDVAAQCDMGHAVAPSEDTGADGGDVSAQCDMSHAVAPSEDTGADGGDVAAQGDVRQSVLAMAFERTSHQLARPLSFLWQNSRALSFAMQTLGAKRVGRKVKIRVGVGLSHIAWTSWC